jgi:DNA-binding NarL/FixJ family response regulator
VHTAHNETEVVLLSLLAGASGCLIKPVSPSELKLAVEDALAGETHLCPRAQTLLGRCLRGWAVVATAEAGLSPREQDVLLCLFQRLPNKDIAEKLKIAKATVHAHVINIFKKLEVHSRAGAARKALSLLVACGES